MAVSWRAVSSTLLEEPFSQYFWEVVRVRWNHWVYLAGQLGGYLPQDVPQGQGVGLVGVSAIGDVIYLTKEVVGFLGGGDDQDCFGGC